MAEETPTVRLRFTLGGDPSHRTARTHFYRGADKKKRDAFVRAFRDRVAWLASPAGRRDMTSKHDDEFSVARLMIVHALDMAAERGLSPLHVLENALLGFEAMRGGPDVRAARDAVAAILAQADEAFVARLTVVPVTHPADMTGADRKRFAAMEAWCLEHVPDHEWRILRGDEDFPFHAFGFTDPASAEAFRQAFL